MFDCIHGQIHACTYVRSGHSILALLGCASAAARLAARGWSTSCSVHCPPPAAAGPAPGLAADNTGSTGLEDGRVRLASCGTSGQPGWPATGAAARSASPGHP